MPEVELRHCFIGDNYAKLFEMPAGSAIGQHAHTRDHRSILLIGRVVLEAGDTRVEITAPWAGVLPAGVKHRIDAIEPSLWACIWDNPEGIEDAEAFERSVS